MFKKNSDPYHEWLDELNVLLEGQHGLSINDLTNRDYKELFAREKNAFNVFCTIESEENLI